MPLPDWPVAFEIGDRRAVGGHLLGALVAEDAALRHLAAAGRNAHAGAGKAAAVGGGAGDHGADAEQRGDDGHRLGALELVAQPLLVAAGDVAGLVRDDADDLVGRFGLHQRAGVDEQAAPGDEGVEARIVDQNDLDADHWTGRPP